MDEPRQRQDWSPPTLTELGSVEEAQAGLSGAADLIDIGSGILP